MNYEIITDNKTPFERKTIVRVVSDEISDVWKKELSVMGKGITIAGFRQGKAPASIVENHVGREEVWKRVRDEVSRLAANEIIAGADPKPLTPPVIDYGTTTEETETVMWNEGDSLVFTVTYNLPPPSPEDIEKDLMEGYASEAGNEPVNKIDVPKPDDGLPPDPRDEIPGSGSSLKG